MKFRHLLFLPCLVCAPFAHAEIYKRVDKDGNVTYSNKPLKGARKIALDPLPTMNAYDGDRGDRDAHYERVKRTTQRDRDATRRKVLEDELSNEEQLLVEARQNLKDQNLKEANTAPGGTDADGSALIGAPAAADGVKHAQDEVDLHERNINAIKQELSGIK